MHKTKKLLILINLILIKAIFSFLINYNCFTVNSTGTNIWIYSWINNYTYGCNFENVYFTDRDPINLKYMFDCASDYMRCQMSFFSYLLFPYYLANQLLFIENNPHEIKFNYYDKKEEIFRNIIYKNPYSFPKEEIGLITFTNFNNLVFNKVNKKEHYYKDPISNYSFRILPITNLRSENHPEGFFNNFYEFNDKPVSITFLSNNYKKEINLKYSEEFIKVKCAEDISNYNLTSSTYSSIFLKGFENILSNETYITPNWCFILGKNKKIFGFGIFCEYNKTNNNRFFNTKIIESIRLKEYGIFNRTYEFFTKGPNSIIYIENITIE